MREASEGENCEAINGQVNQDLRMKTERGGSKTISGRLIIVPGELRSREARTGAQGARVGC